MLRLTDSRRLTAHPGWCAVSCGASEVRLIEKRAFVGLALLLTALAAVLVSGVSGSAEESPARPVRVEHEH